MDAIRALAVEIGPRPAGSPAERRAAEHCAGRLSEFGYDVQVDAFSSRRSYSLWFASYLTLAALGALLIVPLPMAAALAGTVGLVLYARDADGRPLVKPGGVTSRNVVARRPGDGSPRLVVMAHMDSARASLSFHPRLVSGFRVSVIALNVVMAAVPVLGAGVWIAEAGSPPPTALWIPASVMAVYLLYAIGILIHGRLRMPLVAGANDNASGVEVLLRLASSDLGPGVWFVVTGSEEVGMLGAQAFLEAHRSEVSAARFLNIDNVGSGTLLAVESEGVLRERRADGYLLDTAAEAGAEPRPFRGLPTDATVLLGRHLKAVTLLAVNDKGVPDNWHWSTDVIENVDPLALDRATSAARHIVNTIVGAQAGR